MMVGRFTTGPGGTVGPQGGADVSIPVGRLTRPRSIPVEPPYGSPGLEVLPLILYNFEQDSAESTLPNRGTSGNVFDMVPGDGDSLWENYFRQDDDLYPGRNGVSPSFSTQASFGGSYCSSPVSFIVNVDRDVSASFQWYAAETATGGLRNVLSFEVYDNRIFAWVRKLNTGGSPEWQTIADWDYADTDLNATNNTLILTITPGSASAHTLTLNGADFTAATAFHDLDGSCSDLNWEDDPASFTSQDIYEAAGIAGMAMVRGAVSASDISYWQAYDWTNHAGFGG